MYIDIVIIIIITIITIKQKFTYAYLFLQAARAGLEVLLLHGHLEDITEILKEIQTVVCVLVDCQL